MGRAALPLMVAILTGCLPRPARGRESSFVEASVEGTYMLLQTFTQDCVGEPNVQEAFNLDIAFQRFGHESRTCQALPLRNASYRIGSSPEVGACHMDVYSGLDCKTYGRTLPILTGKCLGTHVGSLDDERPSQRRLAEVVAAELDDGDQAGDDFLVHPPADNKVKMWCSRGPLRKGVFDKTCVRAKELPLIRQLTDGHDKVIAPGQRRVDCIRAAGCLPQLRRAKSKEEFEALFQEGGCAASCYADKKLAHHSLVMQNHLDCNFNLQVESSPPGPIVV